MSTLDNLTADDIRSAAGQSRGISHQQEEAEAPVEQAKAPHTDSDPQREVFRQSARNRIAGLQGVGSLLEPLLQATGWRGQDRNLFEALPHIGGVEDIDTLRSTLYKINIKTFKREMGLNQLKESMLPCIVVFSSNHCVVIVDRKGNDLLAYDSKQRKYVIFDVNSVNYEVYLLSELDHKEEDAQTKSLGWVTTLIVRFRSIIRNLILISFISSCVGVAVPLYVMSVYDKVIPTKSYETLGYLFAAALAVLGVDIGLRLIRGKAIAFLGARFETLLGSMAYRQIIYMPIEKTEKSSVGDQISRLRQFEGMRDLFTGPLATTILDLPFTLVFLFAVIYIGGAASWIPLAMVFVFVVIGLVTIPMTRYLVGKNASLRNDKQHFLMEMISNQETIKAECAEEIWVERYKNLSSDAALHHSKSTKLSLLVQNMASAIMMISGVVTLAYTTTLAMEGLVSMGALIAMMSLVWKVLAPFQSIFTNYTKFEQTLQSAAKVNMLMRMGLERNPGKISVISRPFIGNITFNRVSYRYSPVSEPALFGINLKVSKGQIVALVGSSGSGKSTILKMIAGLYTPQGGVITIDGLDSRQIDKSELRHALSYVPQEAYFFFGTVDQNIRLNNPSASDEDVERVMAELALKGEIEALPEGANTRLSAGTKALMSESFKQKLSLARALIKDVPIYLLDEPGNHLSRDQLAMLRNQLDKRRGSHTIILSTHNQELMQMADHIVLMKDGQIAEEGKPEDILPKLRSL